MALTQYLKVEADGDKLLVPVHVCNDNDGSITGVTVTFDAFPAGITIDGFIKEVGTYTTLTRVWAIPLLGANGTANSCAHGYLQVTVDDITLLPASITATIVNAEDGNIPGENETALIYDINIHDTSDVVNTQDTVNASFVAVTGNVPEEKGTMYIVDTTGGNVILTLPALAGLQGGHLIRFYFETAGGNTLTIKGNAAENINGANTYLPAEKEFVEVMAISTGGARWIKLSN